MTRSIDSVTSCMVITFLPRRAVSNALSFMRFIKSAPVKPGVSDAIFFRSTSLPIGLSAACTCRMRSRPLTSGTSTTI